MIPLNERELGVLNDNNYPFSSGRTPGQSDPNEFIVIQLERPLVQYAQSRETSSGSRENPGKT